MSYLNPIRMYVFTSAIFFIVLFSLKRPGDMISKRGKNDTRSIAALLASQARLQKDLQKEDDEDDRERDRIRIRNIGIEIASIRRLYGDSTRLTFTDDQLNGMLIQVYTDSVLRPDLSVADSKRLHAVLDNLQAPTRLNFFGSHSRYNSVEEYDSTERALPDSLRDGWLHPLTEAEVFNAHCTDAATGEPVPPEPGLTFAPGTDLPPPGPPPH